MNFFLNSIFTICDAPRAWGVYFQDSASPQIEALVELHDNIMFYLVIILFGVGWILVSIIRNYVYNKSPISNKYLNHGTLIELIWTITPALILILIAFPTFKLLYLMDEVTDPSLTVFADGHQWYWSYQYPDFLNEEDGELEFGSYLVPVSDQDYINLNSDEAPSSPPEENSDLFDQEVADGEESSEDGECRHVFLPGEYEIYDEDNPSENFGDTCENCNYPYDDEDSVSKCSKCNEWFHSNCYETDWGHIEAESGGSEEAESGGSEEE